MATARLADERDIPALVELMHEFYAESSFPLDHEWAARSFAMLVSQPALGAVWVIEVDGAVAGHAVLSLRHAMEFGGLSGTIDDLFVRPSFRRRGAAQAGLDALLAECRHRGCRSLHVEVGADNIAAQALYRRLGLSPGSDRRQQLSMTL